MKVTVNHIEGSRKGTSQQFDLSMITVGRDPSSSIAFDPHKDDRVSTKHAQIVEQGGQLTISDLGSRNGTYVNGMRIGGPTPLAPGALVQFGEGGPQVMITFDAPAGAPPPAAAAPKKGGGGGACVVIAVLGFFFLAVLAVAFYYLVLPRIQASPSIVVSPAPGTSPIAVATSAPTPVASPATPVASPAAPGASPAAPAASPTPAAPAASPSPAAAKVWESPWKKLGVGTSAEWETVSKMSAMPDPQKSGMRYTLTAKTDDEATLKVETLMANMTLPPQEQKEKLRMDVPAATSETKTLEEKDESVTVPAGTFACHYTKMETTASGMHTVSETWSSKDVPLYVKSKSASDGNGMTMTSESVLTKLDKK